MSNTLGNVAAANVLDVAVVGGGVSGVYSAWRLTECIPASRIAVFEGSDRIGGRLLSLTPPDAPHCRAELGGMTYFSNQPLVRSLVESKFKLPHEVVPPGSSSLAPSPKNLIYLRGKHLRFLDLGNPDLIPYQLTAGERPKSASPIGLVTASLQKAFPQLACLGSSELQYALRETTYRGSPLWCWGFWNIVSQGLSQEAYAYVRDAVGYDSLLMNFNAVDEMGQFLDINSNPTMTKLTGGYQQVPLTLCKEFHDAGGRVNMRHRLRNISLVDGDCGKLVKLEFAANNTGWGPTATGDPVTFYAKRAILAMPRRSLELLEQTGQVFGSNNMAQYLRGLMASVTAIPMFKAFLEYREPWWKVFDFLAGKAVTDLPLRQCFYWEIEGEQAGADPKNTNCLLMATFNDTTDEPYWSTLSKLNAQPRTMRAIGPRDTSFLNPTDWAGFRALPSTQLLMELSRELQTIHDTPPGVRIPEPSDGVFMDWAAEPFGGSHHQWNTGVKSWEVTKIVAHPIQDVPVYICGEAYSLSQGYVEGALESAENVLQSFFGLRPPAWVTPDPSKGSGQTYSNPFRIE